ncbi:DUF448 domain-containing protein [Trichlorobacter ammonificans]|uniref:YlxR domain-containing protein n=1 Tax=Trichlorobacter ammonificans TaxID=2916410 RepID=A0ABM9D760_9BACT|nr:DUF448 domain-containing protein [Trichlorobacter ammonificans]CAH2030857.1 conserved protein of unknown function [Trichlorobacter ammonificans]
MTQRKRSEPQRSCIVCRREGDKRSFLRFVLAPDSSITPDLEQKLPGRGTYTCQSRRCLQEAVKRRQFNRAFKETTAAVTPEELAELVATLMKKRIGAYLSLANKAGMLVSGGDALERALRSAKPPCLLLLADDISGASADKLQGRAERSGIPVYRILTKELMGQLAGKDSDRSAVAIMSPEFARSLCTELERYRNYLEEESSR